MSPLARAIMNKDAGDTAMLGESEIELIAVSPAESFSARLAG